MSPPHYTHLTGDSVPSCDGTLDMFSSTDFLHLTFYFEEKAIDLQ